MITQSRRPGLREALSTVATGVRETLAALMALAAPKGPTTATVFREASPRIVRDWTPTTIRAAEQAADGGQLRQAALLCDAMIGDDRISGCLLETRIRGLLGLSLSFEPGVGRRKQSVVRALEAEEDWWEAFPEDALAEWMVWGILLGVGVGRLGSGDRETPGWAYRERKGGSRVIPVLETVHPAALRWDDALGRWFARDEKNVEHPVTPGDGTWVVYTPYGAKRPWARGAWRSLSRWWLLKLYAQLDWARSSERHGMGLFVGESHEGSNPADREELAADLDAIARDSALALPPGYSIKLVESTANTWSTYDMQTKVANSAIAIRLLGQNLSTEVTGGSFAAAQIHARVAASIIRADDESSATTIHDQALTWWAEFNFGDRRLAPWPKRNTTPPEDVAAKAAMFKVAGESLKVWEDQAMPVDRELYAAAFGLPVLDGADFSKPEVAPPPEAPPAQGGPPAPSGGLSRDMVRLASGDQVKTTSGFVEGQQYTDALIAHSRNVATSELSPWIDEVGAILEELEDTPDWPVRLRERLTEAFGGGPGIETVTERAMILAELAGRAAVQQDL